MHGQGKEQGSSYVGDAFAGDAIAGDAIAGDAIAGDAFAGDAFAGDAIAGDAIAGDAFAGDSLATDSLSHTSAPRAALITGGSGAIGSAAAKRLAARGDHIAIAYHSQQECAESLARHLSDRYGINAYPVPLDMGDPASIRRAVDQTAAEFGRLDILIHAAALTGDKLLVQMKAPDFARVLDHNLTGSFHLLQAVLPHMRRRHYGRIVTLTSYAGIRGRAGQSAYAASKAGLIGLTKTAALEEIAHGITANALAPSVTESAMTAALTEDERTRLLSQIPLGRMQTPDEAAALIAWLTCEEAGTITGQVFHADSRLGGW